MELLGGRAGWCNAPGVLERRRWVSKGWCQIRTIWTGSERATLYTPRTETSEETNLSTPGSWISGLPPRPWYFVTKV